MSGTSSRRLTLHSRTALQGLAFISPWVVGFLLFTAFPFFFSIFLSLQDVRIAPGKIVTTWAGLRSYVDAFTKDTTFPLALANNVFSVAISVPMILVFSVIIALLLNRKLAARGFFRAVFFFPVIIISGPVIAQLLATGSAAVGDVSQYAIYRLIATAPPVVARPLLYVFDNLVIILWFSGVQILIFVAGLQKISGEIFEAAQIDGASAWESFWKITLPFLRPFILVNAFYTIMELAAFANNEVNILIQQHLFEIGKVYSYSASLSWIYFLALMGIMGIAFAILRERE